MHLASRTTALLIAAALPLAGGACNVYTEDLLAGGSGGATPPETGGAPSGGAPTGGWTPTGGVATGGALTGGGGTGGDSPGGATSGGAPIGGAPTGGQATGGAATGGLATGGIGTGGAPTGGVPTGGAATGGVATGGTATGGIVSGGTTTGGAGGASGAATGGSTGGVTTGGVGTGGTVVDPNLIDDFESANNSIATLSGRRGYWYTFHDASAGVIVPDTQDVSTDRLNSALLTGVPRAPSVRGMHIVSTTAFTDWGAGFGCDLNDKAVYDLSPYTGISFYVRSGADFVGAHPRLRIQIKISDIVPNTIPGGTCVPSTVARQECDNAHSALVDVSSTWTLIERDFTAFTQDEAWGLPVTFDPSHALSIQFQAPIDQTFDVWIDDMALY